MHLEPIEFHHLEHMAQVPAVDTGEPFAFSFTPEHAALLMRNNSWAFYDRDVLVYCGGTIQVWPGRHLVWGHMMEATRGRMKGCTRLARQVLDPLRGRLEATALADFAPAHKWLLMLGFWVETPWMAGYGLRGEPHVGYVKIQQ